MGNTGRAAAELKSALRLYCVLDMARTALAAMAHNNLGIVLSRQSKHEEVHPVQSSHRSSTSSSSSTKRTVATSAVVGAEVIVEISSGARVVVSSVPWKLSCNIVGKCNGVVRTRFANAASVYCHCCSGFHHSPITSCTQPPSYSPAATPPPPLPPATPTGTPRIRDGPWHIRRAGVHAV
jgi:hypothetical protein